MALFQLLDFAGGYRWLTYLGCLLSMIHAVFEMLTLVCIWFVMRDLINVAPHWSRATGINRYAWTAFAFAIIAAVCYFFALMCTHLSAFRTTSNVRKAALGHLMLLPLGWFLTHPSGETRHIIDGAVEDTHAVMAHRLPDMSAALMTPIAFVVVSFVFDWRMGVACLIPVVLSMLFITIMLTTGAGADFMGRYNAALDRMSKSAVEYVRGIPVVKTFQQTVYSFRSFREAIVEYRDMATKYSFFCQPWQVAQLVAINGTFVFLVPTAIIISANTGNFSEFLADFLFYVVFSTITVVMMTKVMYTSQAFMKADDAMRRINTILQERPLAQVSADRRERPKDSSIVFDNVTFRYQGADADALHDVSFTVPSGSTVALVGPSGSGKSTVSKLAARFWDPDSGTVTVGGVDIDTIAPETLLTDYSVVFQDVLLFNDTVMQNIRLGRRDATDEEVLAAARAANCDEFIARLPNGYHTKIGENGSTLSGGERQRISIARALLKNAPIVLLDEATASLDAENETKVQQALSRLLTGKTVLIIAHRMRTVAQADKIVVLDEGRVAEEGSPKELMAQNGIFAHMATLQNQSQRWTLK
ncbi:ABC transporter ATP-binding protein [Bifidobacterium mongoliense]|uniref:ABC transporter ATP-binding protein n=1 Tax=Bifidobacterium mongoliense TaxID=518643 RepID=UPI002648623F|nr:ABC transporter ATP-binding protein [Bifidobacterium mongoliense]MDN6025307.1 ABC transporter ATP-binding protein/permease [Bifidobacterium mongoliense]MDN6051673.1 ABC transporter ATP-binding protein/permease [Bifidobacterium mongoliense]MDN6720243.1 ABC transporter ATP-binding protein/permease [Bifidobacterium mongoliense]